MKKTTLTFFAMLLSCIAGLNSFAVESGVSRSFAENRKAQISDITYNLNLSIDSLSSGRPAQGSILIEFDYKPDGQPLVLDFSGEKLLSMSVNSHPDKIDWIEDHIIISPDLLAAGHNRIAIDFWSAGRALNQNPDYMYTLFVPFRAHSVFPCFDQPDLKGKYRLTLEIPKGWKAVSNSPVIAQKDNNSNLWTSVHFDYTEPLSTYLFAFAAGDFEYRTREYGGRMIGAYHREKDEARIAQLDDIFMQVEKSLEMLEEYTGVKYPFSKYDLVILPGFQFGGMEHTGATFYNDNALFLNENPTSADILRRAMIIAHETAHMWFGDYVTMQWFDEVWTKEVFANYFAAMLTRELLPEYNHDLEWLRVYYSSALDQDRSEGTTPILQELDNLNNAGLIYNNIIYNKSPIMLGKLVELTGKEAFRNGVRKYLSEHPYGNAKWEDFVAALSACSDVPVEGFSQVWVNSAGMPHISFALEDDALVVKQTDPSGRGLIWPQSFGVISGNAENIKYHTVAFDGTTDEIRLPLSGDNPAPLIIPSADGRAYGLLTVEESLLKRLMEDYNIEGGVCSRLNATGRLATLIMLNENYLAGRVPAKQWLNFLITSIQNTTEPQMLSALTRYLGPSLLDLSKSKAEEYEIKLSKLIETHPTQQGRLLVFRNLYPYARSSKSLKKLHDIWESGKTETFSEDDLTDLSLHLAVALPDKAESIINTQRERISSPDRLRKFDYISRAASSDTHTLDSLFASLSEPENRIIEPWTLSLLSILNHPTRVKRSIRYIQPALSLLPEIQKTGDIFFPANWVSALLSSYRSAEAATLVRRFLHENENMNPLLLNKVRQAAARMSLKGNLHQHIICETGS